jgi:hypothetical protein
VENDRVSRTIINFWLNVVLLVVFVSLLWVSVVLRFVFPMGAEAGQCSLWGLTHQAWLDLQFGFHTALALGILLHVMLHWNWVCGVISTRILRFNGRGKRVLSDGVQTLYGVGFLVVLLNLAGLAFAVAALTIRTPVP